jgi:hypothetical protein
MAEFDQEKRSAQSFRERANQALRSDNHFSHDLASRPKVVNETHGLTSQKRHRLNVSGRVNVRRDTDESLNRNLRSGDRRSSNDRLLR